MGRAKSSEAGALVLKRGNRRDRGNHNNSAKTGFDGLVEAPWRKMPSIFKQSVTLVRTSHNTISPPTDLSNKNYGREPNEFPRRQIFWAKSLEGLHSMTPINLCDQLKRNSQTSHIGQNLNLPTKIETCVDSTLFSCEAACATLCAALQLSAAGKGPTLITGQSVARDKITDAPLMHVNYTQPIVQFASISEQDIAAQEKRVLDARKRLQELRKSFAIR